jgi:amino acid transporter
MVVVSLGPMADEIGNVSVWIWAVTAAVGGLQCMLIAELASRFPDRAGGTSQFAYRTLRNGSPTFGALSAWCYWFAWTPGIAVNLILAATYLRDLLWPSVPAVLLAFGIGVVLYTITAMGLRISTAINSVLALVAVGVVLIIVLGPVFRPEIFDASQVVPAKLPDGASDGPGDVMALVLKWAFVATWSSYAAEMASTVVAEIRSPERYMRRVMTMSAVMCLVAFSAVPVALFGVVGLEGVSGDPLEAFADAGEAVLGSGGRLTVGLGMTAVLILAAETFIISSSRTVYQMAQDRYLPAFFAKINRRGAPIGSIVLDSVVIGIMLLVFGTDVVNVVAAANVGYLIVFVLLPVAYLVLRAHPHGRPGSFRLPRPAVGLAVLLALFNLVLLVFGGPQWGVDVMAIGVGVSLLIIPISAASRWAWRRRDAAGVSRPAGDERSSAASAP